MADGPVTKSVRALIRKLRESDDGLDEGGEARASLAVHLAKVLDGGDAKMATAAVGRELRACLDDLSPRGERNGTDGLAEAIEGLGRPG